MNQTELMLIDLSGIAHALWHVSDKEPDPGFVATQTVARVRALASQHPFAAVCCDSGRSFRKDIDPAYKAQRDTENRAVIRHQIDVACETLAKDGFPIWRCEGFEADDLIATAVRQALEIPDTFVLVVSNDKDLLQLVSDRVRVKREKGVMDVAAVVEKLGVRPDQVRDYLTLVGDASDNVKGAEGYGEKRTAELLRAHGSIANVYLAIDQGVVAGITPALRTNLQNFRSRWPTVAQLIALRTDAPIPFHEIATERTAPPMVEETSMETEEMTSVDEPDRELSQNESLAALGEATRAVMERVQQTGKQPDAMKHAQSITNAPLRQELAPYVGPPLDFSQQLEPRTMQEAVVLADRMFQSRLFSAYGTPQAVLATVLAGRELGIPAMASLRAFHIIEGKPQMSAGTIQSLVLKSAKCGYFRCSERTAERATFVTKRGDEPEMSLTYTIEEGKLAWQKTPDAWSKSTWGRSPADMLVARASSKLARLVYPDVVSGLYAPEEMD